MGIEQTTELPSPPGVGPMLRVATEVGHWIHQFGDKVISGLGLGLESIHRAAGGADRIVAEVFTKLLLRLLFCSETKRVKNHQVGVNLISTGQNQVHLLKKVYSSKPWNTKPLAAQW